MKCFTPDGLPVHELEGVGLVVEAHQHNAAMSSRESMLSGAEFQRDELKESLKEIVSLHQKLEEEEALRGMEGLTTRDDMNKAIRSAKQLLKEIEA